MIKFRLKYLILLTSLLFIISCEDKDESEETSRVAWDESSDGELSGNLMEPTTITLKLGDNYIHGTSVPGESMECTTFEGGPPDPVIPYMPNHESYTDVFTFEIPENAQLSSIIIEKLDITEIHTHEEYNCLPPTLEEQLGAYTAINNNTQIDWSSNTVQEFISLPQEYPLASHGFAKSVGEDLVTKYKLPFPIPDYDINTSDLLIGAGNHTFWWKDGANQISYTLKFVLTQI